MDNQLVQTFVSQQFGKLRGYLDENGTVYLDAEDVARGLGFVMIRKELISASCDIFISVRWNTVNSYLKQFGYTKIVGKGDFLPENMVFRLAMKADKEAAQDFQGWLADEVVPQICKTGRYRVAGASLPSQSYAASMEKAAKLKKNLEELFGCKPGIAAAKAISITEEIDDIDLSDIKDLLPAFDHTVGRF